MMFEHAIGIYLVAGVVLSGLGHLVRARWIASGQMKPHNLAPGRKWILPISIVLSTLFWPVFLVTLSIGWRIRRKTRKLEETIVLKEMDLEKKGKGATSSYVVSGKPVPPLAEKTTAGVAPMDISGRRPLISKAAEEHTKAVLAKKGRRPQSLERGAPVKKAAPAESLYRCSACGLMLEGPAPASTAQGWPLCKKCGDGAKKTSP